MRDDLSEVVKQHDSILEEHGIQLKVQAEQIKYLQDNAIKLENVVMHENRETRMTITQTNKELHELINQLLGFNTGQNQLTHKLMLAKLESYVKIFGILAGSGGLLYYIFTQ